MLYLTGEFKKEFSIEHDEVIFQRFDDEWGVAVDLEQDKFINDRDKLVAVVTSKLSSSIPGNSSKVGTIYSLSCTNCLRVHSYVSVIIPEDLV